MRLLSVAIVIGAFLLSGAIFLTNRYTLERGNEVSVWRTDQLTGETRLCVVTPQRACWLK